MVQPRLIPLLLIKDGKLQKSREFGSWRYVGDIANAISIFNDKSVDELMILDVDASIRGQGPNFQILRNLAKEAFVPISYGGGVKSREHAAKLVEIGFDRVVVNSGFAENPELVSSISMEVGKSSTSVSFDVIEQPGNVWRIKTQAPKSNNSDYQGRDVVDITAQIRLAEELGAGEIVIQNASRDGKRVGLDLELAALLVNGARVPLVIGGGYANLDDAKRAWSLGASGVVVGSAFVFIGKNDAVMLNYPRRDNGFWLP